MATNLIDANLTVPGSGLSRSLGTLLKNPKVDDASNNSVTAPLKVSHSTSGTPASGIGVGVQFEAETAAGNEEIGASIEAVTTDVTAASEDFDLVFKTMAAGAAAAERLRVNNAGLKVAAYSTGTLQSDGSGNVTSTNSPTAATAAGGTNTTQIATTAFVQQEMARVAANNLVINGGMEVHQRANSPSVDSSVSGAFMTDGMKMFVGSTGAAVLTLSQVADAPAGFKYSAKATVTTADATISNPNDYVLFRWAIEGYRCAALQWGTGSASSISIGFWIKANRTGTYSGSVINANFDQSYAFSFTINSSGTWEYKTVTIAGDTAGTWNTTNGAGMYFTLAMACNSDYLGTAGSWNPTSSFGFVYGVTGTTNGVAATSDYMQITGVSVVPGTVPVPQELSPYVFLSFPEELQRCQRYYEKSFNYTVAPAQNSSDFKGTFIIPATRAGASVNFSAPLVFKVRKRANPTFTFYNPIAANAQAIDTDGGNLATTGTSANDLSEQGCGVQVTGNAGTSLGNRLFVHWAAEATLE
jgi:hypothetical protein